MKGTDSVTGQIDCISGPFYCLSSLAFPGNVTVSDENEAESTAWIVSGILAKYHSKSMVTSHQAGFDGGHVIKMVQNTNFESKGSPMHAFKSSFRDGCEKITLQYFFSCATRRKFENEKKIRNIRAA